jgi:hypothetical protein
MFMSTARMLFVVALAAPGLAIGLSGCDSPPVGATPGTTNSSTAQQSAATAVADSSPAGAKPVLKPGAKTVVLERAGDKPYDKTFDDLRFDMEVGAAFHRKMLPASIEAMNGQRIRIRGYILPTAQSRGIKQFVLVRDNQVCCFGPGAALYDCILVELQNGATEYTIYPIAVDGTFEVREFVVDGKHLAIYHMQATSVR